MAVHDEVKRMMAGWGLEGQQALGRGQRGKSGHKGVIGRGHGTEVSRRGARWIQRTCLTAAPLLWFQAGRVTPVEGNESGGWRAGVWQNAPFSSDPPLAHSKRLRSISGEVAQGGAGRHKTGAAPPQVGRSRTPKEHLDRGTRSPE